MSKERDYSDFPPITSRIWEIVEKECGGNVNMFVGAIGVENQSKVYRLFKRDKRSGNYPVPSTDIISSIVGRFPEYDANYLISGIHEAPGKTVNNVTVNSNKTTGNGNIVGDGNTSSVANEQLLELLMKQQKQIEALFNIVTKAY